MQWVGRTTIGAGILVAAGGVLGRETLAWAWAKVLDAATGLFGGENPTVTVPSPFPWLDVLGLALMGAGIGLVASRYWKRRPGNASWLPAGLYVGAMHVDAQHLGQEFYLDIAIQGFNASGETISISDVQGAIGFRDKVEGDPADRIDLPPSTILHGCPEQAAFARSLVDQTWLHLDQLRARRVRLLDR